MKKHVFMILVAVLCFYIGGNAAYKRQEAPQSVTITGFVFLDINENGIRDSREPGIPGVVVSDQVEAVASDSMGAYRIADSKGYGIAFISIPDNYASNGPFWKHIKNNSGRFEADFPLIRSGKAEEFAFIHASDPHLSEASLPRLLKFNAIVDSVKPAFVLMTGDLVLDSLRVPENEARSYFELYKREIAKLSIPVWSIPGNHEIFGIERDYSLVSSEHPLYGKKMYRHYLGPDYYSFNYGGVHFIGLNTVDYHQLWYYGHLDDTQLAWLEKDLSFVAPKTPVVTFNHIPFYSTVQTLIGYRDSMRSPMLINVNGEKTSQHTVANAQSALALLRTHTHSLALAGHIHARERLTYEYEGSQVRFIQVSAILGDSTFAGMKMISGVILYRVKNGEIDDGEFIPLEKAE
ncbi:MAG: metallophosphoesterase [Candidatus Aminicenantes bacterium]|nr:metallophosphoesterase [Candidatus Aminicenantes bacterium]